MSSFTKKGLRESKRKVDKKVKLRIKDINKILNEVENVARLINENVKEPFDVSELSDIASEFTDMPIEGFEELLLLSKLSELGKINKEVNNEDK